MIPIQLIRYTGTNRTRKVSGSEETLRQDCEISVCRPFPPRNNVIGENLGEEVRWRGMVTFLLCLSQLQFEFGHCTVGHWNHSHRQRFFFWNHIPVVDSSGILLDSEVLRRSPSYKYKFYPWSNLSVASSGLGTLLFIAMLGLGVPGEAGVSIPSEAPFLEGTTWPTLRSPPN